MTDPVTETDPLLHNDSPGQGVENHFGTEKKTNSESECTNIPHEATTQIQVMDTESAGNNMDTQQEEIHIESKKNVSPVRQDDNPDNNTRTCVLEDEASMDVSNDLVEGTQAIRFDKEPVQVTGAFKEYSQSKENFLKGCKWSPDGYCILTNSDDNCLRLYNLPEELYTINNYDGVVQEMKAVLKMREGALIYDYCWYPGMSSADPSTCCLVSTSRDKPIHMWDAFDGELRCSYRAFNQVDELVSAHSLSFDIYGEKLYAGYNKMIRLFDVNRPGRQIQDRPTHNKEGGQCGIISCIAMQPSGSMYAAGSYSKQVGLYDASDGSLIYLLEGHSGGVTHLQFSPDGDRLYSGGRKDNEILCWDIRNPGQLLYILVRQVATNQRIYFDIDSSGHHLVSGHHNGLVLVWDVLGEPVQQEVGEPLLKPITTFKGHHDTANGASFHPSLPLLATSSGQRHFKLPEIYNSDNDSDNDAMIMDRQSDNSLRLWRFSK